MAQLRRPCFSLIAGSVLLSTGHCSTLLLEGTACKAVTDGLIDCPVKCPPFHGCQGGPAALMDSPCPPDSRAKVDWCCRGLHQHLGGPDQWGARGGWPHRQGTWFHQPRQCKFYLHYTVCVNAWVCTRSHRGVSHTRLSVIPCDTVSLKDVGVCQCYETGVQQSRAPESLTPAPPDNPVWAVSCKSVASTTSCSLKWGMRDFPTHWQTAFPE